MLQTVAAVCVGVVAAMFIYYVSNKETPQRTNNNKCGAKENSTYAEFYDPRKGLGVDNCPICQNSLSAEPFLMTSCEHKLHIKCFDLCRENGIRNCPQCRKKF